MKIKQLVTGVTAIGAVRAESGSFWVMFGIFIDLGHHCGHGDLSWSVNDLLSLKNLT